MDTEITLLVGGIIGGIVGIVKTAWPTLPSRFTPLFTLALATAVIIFGVYSGEIEETPLRILAAIVEQTTVAMGLRAVLQWGAGQVQPDTKPTPPPPLDVRGIITGSPSPPAPPS